jgi:nucleoside-diphosphate-sugar epimerase
MNILVIGGSGLFGRKTVWRLLQDQEVSKVVSMDITPPREWFLRSLGQNVDRFHFIHGDVSQMEDIINALKLYSIQRIINWAFILGENVNANPRLSVKVNALGMSNVFEAARLMGIFRVVYASSETVYGSQADYGDREVNEDDRLYPSHPYALCKRLAEILAEQYTQLYGMSFSGLRPTIGYGHGGQSPFIVKWFSEIVSFPAVGKPVSLDVDGKGFFSLVYAEDLAELTRILIKAPSSPHPVYNIGGPPRSLKDVAEQVLRFIPDASIKFGNQPMIGPGRSGLPWKVSCARARDDFGFSLMPLEKAVLKHINDARFEVGLEAIHE